MKPVVRGVARFVETLVQSFGDGPLEPLRFKKRDILAARDPSDRRRPLCIAQPAQPNATTLPVVQMEEAITEYK